LDRAEVALWHHNAHGLSSDPRPARAAARLNPLYLSVIIERTGIAKEVL
jgi:hypothetical protein